MARSLCVDVQLCKGGAKVSSGQIIDSCSTLGILTSSSLAWPLAIMLCEQGFRTGFIGRTNPSRGRLPESF